MGDTGGSIQPGGKLTVCGSCLDIPGGAGPRAALVQGGSLIASLPIAHRLAVNGYAVSYTVPNSLPPGTYELYVHNGCGGSAGWVRFTSFLTNPIPTINATAAPASPTAVIDLTLYAGANDDARFASAIAAVPAGGGTIMVPAGSYGLTKSLILPDGTTLVGAGRTATTLQWTADPPDNGPLLRGANKPGGGRFSFHVQDLSLVSTASFTGNGIERAYTTMPGSICRVGVAMPRIGIDSVQNGRNAIFLRQVQDTVIEDCVLDAVSSVSLLDNVSNLRLSKNIMHWRWTSVYIRGACHNLIITDNLLNQRGDSVINGWSSAANPNPGAWYTAFGSSVGGAFTKNVLWSGNRSTRDTAEIPPSYVGFTYDGGQGIYYGGITSASGTSLQLTGTTLSTLNGNPVTYDWAGAAALIVSGRGAGQWRYLASATAGASSVSIDRPWDIDPDATSVVSLINLQGRLLMIGNDYAQEPLVQPYFHALDLINAGNSYGVDGRTSNMTLWSGTHYVGHMPAWHALFLDNTVIRGPRTHLTSFTAASPAGFTAATQVYRRNISPSGAPLDITLGSKEAPWADCLIEHNQAAQITLARTGDPAIQLDGVVIRDNAMVTGGASVLSLGGQSLPAGAIAPGVQLSAWNQNRTTGQDTPCNIALGGSSPNSQPWTYIIVSPPTHGTLSGSSAVRTYTPTAGYAGHDSFRFQIDDGSTTSAIATIAIEVIANQAPIAISGSTTTANNRACSVLLSSTDSDGGAPTYSIAAAPIHGTLSGTNETRTYTPFAGYIGTDSFTFVVNDGRSQSSTATVFLTITAPIATSENQNSSSSSSNCGGGILGLFLVSAAVITLRRRKD
jgi:hypothetical protein